MQFEIYTDEILYDPDDPDSIKNILSEYNKRVEGLINENPEQWMWIHRRWRRRPGVDYELPTQRVRSSREYVDWLNKLAQERRVPQNNQADNQWK
jgi:lauroyl/myristoyl acyltransferase